jgi:integrase
MVLISINTGIRRGELFSLKWSDINLEHRTLTVSGTNAKSGKTRHIPLNGEAFETLKQWRTQSSRENELVFTSPSGGRFDNICSSWEGVLDLAKVTSFRWHDLRHHFASMLVMKEVDLNTVRELLGHGDLKMTIRYAHLAPQVKADAVAKLDLARGDHRMRQLAAVS